MLSASAIRVLRGGKAILDDVSLSVGPGEVVAVIGPNGAGKSTLLHVLSGALQPEEGTVRLDGRPLNEWSRHALACKRAVLPQMPNLSFPFSTLDVVLLGRSPHAGLSNRHLDFAIAEVAMRETDVLHLAQRIYTTLSGGERQRAQLARVLAQIWPSAAPVADDNGNRYLLLDEPTNNLDIGHQQAMMITAKRFAGKGGGVLAVLHDPNLAALYADRICVLAAGRVAAAGPPEAVITETLLHDAFGVQATVMRHAGRDRPFMVPA